MSEDCATSLGTRPPSHRGIHQRHNGTMHVSARVDYGMKALMELTVAAFDDPTKMVKSESISRAQGIPTKFLENILRRLREGGIVVSQRGAEGGFRLARDPGEVTVADVIRVLDGPLATVQGEAPEDIEYGGNAEHLAEIWVATRAAMRHVLETVTLVHAATGELPAPVGELLESPGAWRRR